MDRGDALIPVAITRALEKLVRERDRYKRLAQDRAPVRSADRRREIAARDQAVRELLFLVAIEGTNTLTRGGRGCIERAIEALRPDLAKVWVDDGGGTEGARAALVRFYPEKEDLEDV